MGQLVTRRSFVALLMLSGLAIGQPALAQNGRSVKTYIALGDSIAFGETDVLFPSFGDQGYVGLYADFLATQFDGKRPNIVNLGIVGETSTSFFTGVVQTWWGRVAMANLNYDNPGAIQFNKFLEVVQAEKAARHQIKVVSFALGGDDVIALSFSPAWNAPGADQLALLEELFAEMESNYVRFLTALRTELPHTKVLLLNYYNAFDFLPPDDPTNLLLTIALQRHDAMVQQLSAEFKAHRVDVYSAFQGHALEYTFIGVGNIHPNALGYSVIAQEMINASEN